MPGTTLSESRKWETIDAPPADGDAVSVSSGTAPFRANFMEKMAARDSYLYNGPFHGFREDVRSRVVPNGTWTLKSCGRLALERSDGSGVIDVFSPANVSALMYSAVAPGGYSYVYAYNLAGVLSIEWGSVSPSQDLRFKSTDPSRAYLGCVLGDLSSEPVPHSQSGRSYRLAPKVEDGARLVGPTPNNESGLFTLPSKAPPHAIAGYYEFELIAGVLPSGGVRTGSIRAKNCLPSARHEYVVSSNRVVREVVCVPIFDGEIQLEVADYREARAQANLIGWEE